MSTTTDWEPEYLDWKAGRRPDLDREYFLRNHKGAMMGGPPLDSRIARMAQLDALWDLAESRAAENVAALARTVCRIAASALRRPAPDALAVYGAQGGADGREDALLVLRAAGYDPEPQAQRWAQELPVHRQASSRTGELYADDPMHDPRVIAALREGRSMAEVADIGAEVAAGRRRAKQEALDAAGQDPSVLWVTRAGKALRDGGAATPLMPQRSVVRCGVPELGSEPVPPGAAVHLGRGRLEELTMPDYRDHIEDARDLLELAAQTAEGRRAVRRWAQQVADALPADEQDEPVVLQPVPPGLAGSGYVVNRDAMRRSGYDATAVALSETGGAGIGLYPDVPGAGLYLAGAAGPYDGSDYPGPGRAGNGGTMQYDMAALQQAAAQDEIDRYALMMQGRRPGPARPQYAGLRLSEPWPLEEADADDVVQATMELAARAGEAVTFGDCAEAVDELALSRTPETSGESSSRADALVSLAGMFPARSPAAQELDLELARQREIDRITREHTGRRRASDRIARRQGAMPDEAETAEEEVDSIVERHRDMLSHAPREGRAIVRMNSDRENYNRYGEPVVDRITGRQPRRGGVMHPEVERLAREHGLYLGPPAGNETYPVKSAPQHEREEVRARAGHQGGLFSIEQLHRQAMRSALSSRG
jgi:hypothetical protein